MTDEDKYQSLGGGRDKEQEATKLDTSEDGQSSSSANEDEKLPPVPFGQLFRHAEGKDKLLMAIGTVGAIANGAALPLFSLLLGQLVNGLGGDPKDASDTVGKVALYYVYIAAGTFVAGILQVGGWMTAAERQTNKLRQKYLQAVLDQEIGWFDTNDPQQLATRISEDAVLFQEGIGEKVGHFIQHVGMCITGFIVAFVKGWQLTLVLLAASPLLIASGAFMGKLLTSLSTKGQAAYAKAGAVAEESIGAVRTVATFCGERKEIARYRSFLDDALAVGIKKGRASGIGLGLTFMIMFCSYALAFWYGSKLVYDSMKDGNDDFTGGDVLSVFFSVMIGSMAMGQTTPDVTAMAAARGAAAKINQILDRKPLIPTNSEEGLTPNLSGDVVFKNVDFHYPSRKEATIFDNFNLQINDGQTVALVGSSGSGKSTIVSLLERFYDPLSGAVTIGGTDIKEMNVKWLRQHMSIVSQEPTLFATTIRENIAYGVEGVSMEQIVDAAKSANAHDFISTLPDGYDTYVGDRGVQLSGGQKQRVAIARAILKNPRILLLDEATSALDSESEQVVQEALDRLMDSGSRTTIVIAHRLSTIRNADKIVVLEKGRVVEEGNHQELLRRNGKYAEYLKRSQLSTAEESSSDVSVDITDAFVPTLSKTESNASRRSSGGNELKQALLSGGEGDADGDSVGPAKKTIPWSRVMRLNKPEYPVLAFGIMGSVINGCCMPAFSIIFSKVTAVFYETDPDQMKHDAEFWALMFLALGGACLVAQFLQAYCFNFAGENLTLRVREMTFAAILRQEIGWFDDEEHSTGKLTARLANDAALVQGVAGQKLGLSVSNLVTMVAGLSIAFYYGPKLAAVVLAITPVLMVAGYIHTKALQGFTEQGSVAYADAGQVITDAVSGVRTVHAFTGQAVTLATYEDKLAEPQKLGVKKGVVSGVSFGFSNGVIFGAYALSFWYGSVLITDREMDIGEVMRVIFAVVMSAMGVSQTAAIAPDAGKASAAVSNIFSIIDRQSKIDPSSREGEKPNEDLFMRDIAFTRVRFRYPSRQEIVIFDNVTITVPANSTVALVGSSGSGKSTIVSLLERFYDPLSGAVTIGGTDIKEMNVKWLRQHMSIVSQEPTLFATTIRENIAYGVEGVSMEQIVDAAKSANAHDFISTLPDGYDTYVGDRGVQLSGGQKQRVAIARAILKNPRILLLDEATSALDSESEQVVQEALDRLMDSGSRTTIVIAHRLSTIRNADKIVVLEKGRVVEEGNHQELLRRNGKYKTLVETQMGAN